MSNTFDKLSVLDSFIEEVNSYLPTIEANLRRLAQAPGDMDALDETYRCTHTIGGSASMMDFPGLAHVAHGMEDILGDALEGIAALDDPSIGLLQRSLGRLRFLLQGIHNGIDENAVMTEDDNDYMQYRTQIEAAARVATSTSELSPVAGEEYPEAPLSPASPLPSFDEVLESFRASSSLEYGADGPVEATPPANDRRPAPATPPAFIEPVLPAAQSALERLVASTRPVPVPSVAPTPPQQEPVIDNDRSVLWPAAFAQPQEGSGAMALSVSQVVGDLQTETQSLVVQASSLKDVLRQMRGAMSVIEMQRGEFKGFLDGSKDALDRMEDWAGKAMGLNLRNSPEQVRRYLPLSVMWVANTKLKKVLELLKHIADGVEMTDEQIQSLLKELSLSIAACGETFLQAAATRPAQQPGWTPWEAQISRDADALRESVTFERRGDPQALRAEIESQVREELQQEYEARSASLAARAELERQIREEVRQEFEVRRQLLQQVEGAGAADSVAEIEERLRSQIEIQVRQEFLAQIGIAGGDVTGAVGQAETLRPPVAAPRTSNFLDQVRTATGMPPREPAAPEPPPIPVSPAEAALPPAPFATAPAVHPVTPTSVYSGEYGEEAAEIFRMEAEEHLQTISMHVAALEQEPANRELIQGVRRATHTLKGAASMMGFRAIADISHISEDLLDSIMEGTTSITSAVLSLILDTAEMLDVLINGRGEGEAGTEAKIQVLRVRYAEILGSQQTAASPERDIIADEDIDEAAEGMMTSTLGGTQFGDMSNRQAVRGDLSVRVRLQKLDELVNLFGELLVNRTMLEERIERLLRLVADTGVSSNRLRDVGQKLESRFEAATLPSGRTVQVLPGMGQAVGGNGFAANGNRSRNEPSHLAEFDELEFDRYTEFHQLTRGLSEGISDMTTLSTEMEAVIRDCESVFARENRLSTTFQDRLMKARLVPLSMMTPRLYRAAQAVALKQGKDFEFLLEGQETEVDRAVYEEIAGPLLHLMRNAISHAIESPEIRQQKGKAPKGQIKLSAGYEGNQVYITVRDDGAGIDPDLIRRSAIARGLIHPDQTLSEDDVVNLIFRPGFSTAESLSEESGRGVGLDVVHDSVSRLRGTLMVESMPDQGTAFTMKFPTSLAIQSTMMVRVSDQQFALPTVIVGAIGRMDSYHRTTIGGRPAVTVQHEHYPLQSLADLLSLPSSPIDDKSQVLLVNTGTQRVALVVDEIRGKMDIVMKNLGPHLKNVRGIAGGTVMGNGRVVLVLEMSELLSPQQAQSANVIPAPAQPAVREAPASSVRVTARPVVAANPDIPGKPTGTATPAHAERGKYVLVVDDSPSVRRVVSSMLKQYGWEVQMARDGVEALEMISRETPAAVLLDIEMPRMDGYELTATLRAQEQYRLLPLVVLTSRAASKHQQRAMQLGANAYVVKPYQDEELINLLNALVYGAAAR
jgi:chemotaxis protein histidine kinase CheA/ActR/RegA family two-component response regulator